MWAPTLAGPEDVVELTAMMRESAATLSVGFYDEDQAAGLTCYVAQPDMELIEDQTFYVVRDEGRIVACGGWSRRVKLYTGTHGEESQALGYLDPATDAARLRAMFVRPSHARRSLGRAVGEACERAAANAGFRRMTLMATLPGVPLYESMGYRQVKPENLTLPNGVVLPCLRMEKEGLRQD